MGADLISENNAFKDRRCALNKRDCRKATKWENPEKEQGMKIRFKERSRAAGLVCWFDGRRRMTPLDSADGDSGNRENLEGFQLCCAGVGICRGKRLRNSRSRQ